MPITTRAAKARRAEPRTEESLLEESPSASVLAGVIEEHLKQAQAGVRSLTDQLRSLREENERLKLELETAQQISVVSNSQRKLGKSKTSIEDDTNLAEIRILTLESKVKELHADNLKKKRAIEKFKKKELQNELKDLGQPQTDEDKDEEEEIDPEYRMRKLLRTFSDLMIVTTIADDKSQECPICYETLRLKECSALTCQHILCHNCLPKVSKGADETVECAECRKPTPRDEVELVHMTERDRWDQLLAVAQAWDAFDVRGEEDTTEEEEEEDFINDDMETSDKPEASEVENETAAAEDAPLEAASVVNEDNRHSSPSPPPKQGFSQSPMKVKRKIMEQLAADRFKKRK